MTCTHVCMHRYIDDTPVGFLSFLFDFEDGHEVAYCYELQLMQDMQKSGIGSALMRAYLAVAEHAKVCTRVYVCFWLKQPSVLKCTHTHVYVCMHACACT